MQPDGFQLSLNSDSLPSGTYSPLQVSLLQRDFATPLKSPQTPSSRTSRDVSPADNPAVSSNAAGPPTPTPSTSKMTLESYSPYHLDSGIKRRSGKLSKLDRKMICEYAREHSSTSQTELGVMFGVERSTISKTLKEKEKWLSLTSARKTKKLGSRYPEVEDALQSWAKDQSRNKVFLNDELLKSKALEFAKEMYPGSGFKASLPWLEKFKKGAHIKMGRFAEEETESEDELREQSPAAPTHRDERTSALHPPSSASKEVPTTTETTASALPAAVDEMKNESSTSWRATSFSPSTSSSTNFESMDQSSFNFHATPSRTPSFHSDGSFGDAYKSLATDKYPPFSFPDPTHQSQPQQSQPNLQNDLHQTPQSLQLQSVAISEGFRHTLPFARSSKRTSLSAALGAMPLSPVDREAGSSSPVKTSAPSSFGGLNSPIQAPSSGSSGLEQMQMTLGHLSGPSTSMMPSSSLLSPQAMQFDPIARNPKSSRVHRRHASYAGTPSRGAALPLARSKSGHDDISFDEAYAGLRTVKRFLEENPTSFAHPKECMMIGELFGRWTEIQIKHSPSREHPPESILDYLGNRQQDSMEES